MIDPSVYRFRQQKLYAHLADNDLEAVVLVDFEGLRNNSLRYLCGQPGDALLFLFSDRTSLLVPWDLPLSREWASADERIAFATFDRSIFHCIKTVFEQRSTLRAELTAALPYPLVQALIAALANTSICCREGGIDSFVESVRTIKEEGEIRLLRCACGITDRLIDALAGRLGHRASNPDFLTELDVSLFLEAEARREGAESMGFDTLVASGQRSHAIHCFPNVTSAPLKGLSIVDFGVRYAGYTSDVTLTLLPVSPTGRRRDMIDAVREAYDLAVSLCGPGVDPVSVGEAVQQHFEDRGFHMPHSLGHGIGLDAHEQPSFRRTSSSGVRDHRQTLEPGMVFTLEPGLYDPRQGGVRLENDFLCTQGGVECLTSARFLEIEPE